MKASIAICRVCVCVRVPVSETVTVSVSVRLGRVGCTGALGFLVVVLASFGVQVQFREGERSRVDCFGSFWALVRLSSGTPNAAKGLVAKKVCAETSRAVNG